MSEDRYIHIRNWERHQHYKKRNPVWIKVYSALLDDPNYRSLTFFNRALLHELWLLTARMGNGRIPWSPSYLIDVLHINPEEDETSHPRDTFESGSGRGRDALRKRVGRGLDRLQSLDWLYQGVYEASASESASTNASEGVPPASPEREGEKKSLAARAKPRPAEKAPRRRDELFDEVTSVLGIDPTTLTPSGRGPLNKALSELRSVGATADQIRPRFDAYLKRFPDAACTASALAKHWGSLGNGNGAAGPMMAANQKTWRPS